MTTGRRRAGDFDSLLEQWARWLAVPDSVRLGGGSLLSRWMAAKGHLAFGGGGGFAPVETMESRIEAIVQDLGLINPLCEDVLRLEYAAGWWMVVKRRSLSGYDPRGLKQLQQALHLGIGLRTYKQRLAEARAFVADRLGRKL